MKSSARDAQSNRDSGAGALLNVNSFCRSERRPKDDKQAGMGLEMGDKVILWLGSHGQIHPN